MEIDSSHVPRVAEGLVFRKRGDLYLILHPEQPRWLVANRLGKEIIDLCDGRRDVSEICRLLGGRYGKRWEEIEPDTEAFLQSAYAAGLAPEDRPAPRTASNKVAIKGIFLHVTDRCNLRCVHCYVGEGDAGGGDLPSDRIHALIDEISDMGGRSITLSGGEPLLRRDWADIVKHACEGLNVTLNTNGTLVTETVAGRLAEARPIVQVSLDGPDAETHDRIRGEGTYASALRGVRVLKDAGLGENLILSMTLMKQNIARAPEMIDLAVSLGVPKIRFLPLHSQGRARSSSTSLDASRDEYFRWFRHVYLERTAGSGPVEVYGGLIGFLLRAPAESDEHWCSIGRTLVVDSAGDVHPCALLMDPRLTVGNIHDASVREIEASPNLKDLTMTCLARSETIEKCRACLWRNFCRASCPAFPFLDKGTFLATDEFCEFRQQLYEDAIFTIARRRVGGSGTGTRGLTPDD